MLHGIDISHWNESKVLKGTIDFRNEEFIIMKATEGVSFKDKYLDRYYDMLHGSSNGKPDKNKLYGFYHFARFDKNQPEAEAKWFLSKVRHHAGEALFILDVEAQNLKLKNIDDLCKRFCDYIYKETKVRTMIYTSQSVCKRLKATHDAGYPLWVAEYGVKTPKSVAPWSEWKIWQHTSVPWDKDVFNGTFDDFKALCRKDE